jgi:hypothetical protein
MALREIDVPRMRYTDENGLPIDKLMYIGLLTTILSTIHFRLQYFSGYEIASMKSELRRRQIPQHLREICERNLKDALQDMRDELAAYHLAQNVNKTQRAQKAGHQQQVPMQKTSSGNITRSAMMNEARMVLNTTGVQRGNVVSNRNAPDEKEQIRILILTEQIEKLRGTFAAAGNGRRV